MRKKYVHGYKGDETDRLRKQAIALKPYLKGKMFFPNNCKILEAGCGVGAQTTVLAKINPSCKFTCVDKHLGSLKKAKKWAAAQNLVNVQFVSADILDLPFKRNQFDYCFFCFVLEHFHDPVKILRQVSNVVKSEGSIRAIECDLGAAVFSPYTEDIQAVTSGAIKYHAHCGGIPNMGSCLESVMKNAKLRDIKSEKIHINTQDPVNGMHAFKVLEEILIPVYKGMKEQMINAKYIKKEKYYRGMGQLEFF